MANFHIPIETANQDASLRIDGYHAALSYIPAFEEIIKKFDGKVYNCRFDNAVREATNIQVRPQRTWRGIRGALRLPLRIPAHPAGGFITDGECTPPVTGLFNPRPRGAGYSPFVIKLFVTSNTIACTYIPGFPTDTPSRSRLSIFPSMNSQTASVSLPRKSLQI